MVIGNSARSASADHRPQLAVSFRYFTNPQPLEFCVGENDFAFADHSEDARWPRSPFAPFTPVSDLTPALHFGFTSKPPSAAVSILAHVLEPAAEGAPQPFVWDYWGSRGWTELSVRDTTSGLMRTGLIQFVGAPDAMPRDGLGGALYRIRARLKSGLTSHGQIVRCGGFWLNAVWARQGQSIEKDRLGISNGKPDQTFALPIVRGAKAAAADAPPRTGELVADDPDAFDRALDAAARRRADPGRRSRRGARVERPRRRLADGARRRRPVARPVRSRRAGPDGEDRRVGALDTVAAPLPLRRLRTATTSSSARAACSGSRAAADSFRRPARRSS